MCGIAGGLFTGGRDPAAAVRLMSDQMRRRGPDAAGEWADPSAGIYLGHRRLAIIDLDTRANQPFPSADGRHVMVFNGEIYNYRELRADLERQGVVLRTTSDTEVVLELYRRIGTDVFRVLRGMFALAIWDADEDRLVLARDPYGIKPLYIATAPDGVLFASQVKALLATNLVSRTRDNAGVAGFYLWGSVPEPFTIYRDVQAVPAGCYAILKRGGSPQVSRYADLIAAWRAPADVHTPLEEQVRAAIQSSTRAHLVADVPIAVLLSGGVDSGVIAGLMAEHGGEVEGVTVRFAEFDGTPRDETPRAAELAKAYGLKHTIRTVGRDEFVADLPRLLDAMDQPSIDGVNTWFASKAVSERGYKVVLSGVGGDELFCGYDTFTTVPRLHALGRRINGVGGLANVAFAAAARVTRKPKLAAIPKHAASLSGAYMLRRALLTPGELSGVMSKDAAMDGLVRLDDAPGAHDLDDAPVDAAAVAALESTRYLRNQLLRDGDWASMAHSLELRTPLVDWDLLQALGPLAARFSGGAGKRLLGGAPRTPPPASVLSHRKTGFGLPIGEWLADVAAARDRPATLQYPWARRWAWVVADTFGFADGHA